ncbi:MAG: DEAD/DEAH box helicase [Rhabdochlamydiaceae bacterium]|nr:DEAD/DEAH box helicase [Rhabdochlamydiaceae bacterium]
MITDYHAKLFAHELLRRCPSDSVERFTAALMDSQVDLNPHQVDAALFAFRSPLSKGAILADEVGLGKTIEAGIVLSQKWAERKRKLLIILPSSLRKQWHQELQEKFYLSSMILETASFKKAVKEGKRNPFDVSEIVICSYSFARNKADFIKSIPWDLIVIDEAHRLRNVYKTGNKVARELKEATGHAPKLLLTATPLQNSLLELYGLVSFIDEHAFGDLTSFRSQFSRLTSEDNFDDLKNRLSQICKRTLRRQVLKYIQYTERKAHTEEFIPTADEEVLYDMISDYLCRPNLQALPSSQRSLMTLVLRRLLASSTFAIAGALESLTNKLEKRLKNDKKLDRALEEDFERFEELSDELEINDEEMPRPLTPEERQLIQEEILELRRFFDLSMKISQNAKGESLLKALKIGFQMTGDLGGAEKAIIFTESRRTQNYLVKLLSENGYSENLVLFNGSNTDERSKSIYAEWESRFRGTDKVTGSKTADTRAALVDYFREKAKIMIATEAAAEGINLQFCSLVVNYDLPWNPQRIEQRIGRCHRYGQKHDVVVVNFLNKNNAADQRVYQLLSEKFRLFDGVFGASDEVLGCCIESGIEFEKRIANIYQTCRKKEDIQSAFDTLQQEMSEEITENMLYTRQKLLENFDAEVAEKLNIYKAKTAESLSLYEALLWDTTQHVLKDQAVFNEAELSFTLKTPPQPEIQTGLYTLKRQDSIGYHYRSQHPLANWVLSSVQEKQLPSAELIFHYTGQGRKISALESLIGCSGTLEVKRLTVKALDSEDHILSIALTDKGSELDADQARRLFNLPADVRHNSIVPTNLTDLPYQRVKSKLLSTISERSGVFFQEEMDKLDRWADDKRQSLKTTLDDYDSEIKELKKQVRTALNFPEKLAIQRSLRILEKKRDTAWKEFDEAVREINRQKDDLIDQTQAKLKQDIEEETLFIIQWKLI